MTSLAKMNIIIYKPNRFNEKCPENTICIYLFECINKELETEKCAWIFINLANINEKIINELIENLAAIENLLEKKNINIEVIDYNIELGYITKSKKYRKQINKIITNKSILQYIFK